MANCGRRSLSLTNFALFLLPSCIAVISIWPFLQRNISSPLLQPFHTEHLQVFNHPTEAEEARFLIPGFASLRGRRSYQEDRTVCSPGINVSHPTARNVGLFGVFDGHLGDSASDFAASSITERFLHHTSLRVKESLNISSMFLQLEATLVASISDIDAAFSKTAATHNLKSGSTACVALQVDNNIIVANVGDSRAFFCSSCKKRSYRSQRSNSFEDPLSKAGAVRSYERSRHHMSRLFVDTDSASHSHSEGFCARNLSSDHRPDRPDEKLRIEAFGGFVTQDSLPRVNGQLAVSRSIGDIDFRKYGVISEPEISGWHQASEDDNFLIIASDGIFEKLNSEEVCNVLHALWSGKDLAAVMNHFESSNVNNVIALPGIDFQQYSSAQVSSQSSNWERPELGSVDRPLTMSPQAYTNQGSDGSWMASMPFLSGASSYAQILAHFLVEIAFRAGSMDNLSIVVVPLKRSVTQ